MKLPEYTNTNLIISYLIKIELSLERINNTPLPRKYQLELREDIFTEDINALSHLINYPIDKQDSKRVYQGKVLPSSRSKMLIFNNYRNSLEFAKNYDRNNFVAPSSELIMHINKITGNKIAEEWDAGSMRSLSEKPVDVFDSWLKYRDYYPGLLFEEHFDEVMRLFDDPTNRIPFYVRIALFTFEMIEKAPLFVVNQISTISTISALSKDEKKNPDQSIPFSKVFNYISDDIEPAYKMSKSRRDATPFIEAFLYSLSLHLVELENQYADVYEHKVKKHGALEQKFNKRQIKALDYLETNSKISRDDYAKMSGVSFMTAYRDLQELLGENYISKHGHSRGTYYKLVEGSSTPKNDDVEIFSDVS